MWTTCDSIETMQENDAYLHHILLLSRHSVAMVFNLRNTQFVNRSRDADRSFDNTASAVGSLYCYGCAATSLALRRFARYLKVAFG